MLNSISKGGPLDILGAIASIFSLIESQIKSYKKKNNCQTHKNIKQISINVENKNTIINEIKKTVINEKDETSSIKNRIEHVLRCMNHKVVRGSEHIMNKEIATVILGLKSVKEFDNLSIDGNIDFIKNFSKGFNISYNWLLSGEGTPFKSKYKPYELIDNIINDNEFALKEKYIIAMKEKTNSREIILIQKIREHVYEYDPAILDFYDTHSGGGRSRLEIAYRVLRKIKINQYQYVAGSDDVFTEKQLCMRTIWKNSLYDWLDTVCVIDDNMFYNLQNGNIYPGSVLAYRKCPEYNYLINSFVDISNENIKDCQNDRLLYEAMSYLKDNIN